MLQRSLVCCRSLLLQGASKESVVSRPLHRSIPALSALSCFATPKRPSSCRALHSCHGRFDKDKPVKPAHGVNWDNFGIWNNRIEEPILLQQSIKHGIPIPKISIKRIGQDSLTGRRAVNEDRICIKELWANLLYVAVFDGHAGSMAVDFVHQQLEHHLNFWLEREHSLQVVLHNAFIDLNNKLTKYLHLHYPESDYEHTGSTATVTLIRNGNELVVGSVGDSRAILCRNGKAMRLINDHEPEFNSKEKDRIKASGGHISWNSLGKPLVNGILTMTRSFGDVTLKQYGVIAVPETRSLEIKHGRDSFLALCTDGVHFVMSDQELCDSINLCHNPQEAASFIADQALQFGSDDNASVVVVPLAQWGRNNGPSLVHSLRWQGRQRA
ncbi:protein phosphatase Mn(2+)-dependent 1K-like [Diadema antillarum]|uniref:protein phosphatase Mn(2+)-dependent 1K-like n=1 Tax=Diadema antillarum TaxID=105358 RepID=UPI003A854B84